MNAVPAMIALGFSGLLFCSSDVTAQSCGSAKHESTRTVAMSSGDCAAKMDIVDTAVSAGNFKTLAAALQAADLVDALKGDGPFTVFAPTDEAFSRVPKETLASLLRPENKATLQAVLTYHVVPGAVEASQAITLSSAPTLNGQRIDITVERGTVRIDDARVVKTDIRCRNGVIHVIDRVILPSGDSILTTAAKAGSFTTLAAAIDAAGLTETLQGPGPFTVFAPTNAAFAKLPPGTVQTLLKPENREMLIQILTYHVVPGRVYSGDALSAGTLATVEGADVQVRLDGRTPRVNQAVIETLDIDTSNGVIHVIDEVILPGQS